MSKSKSDFSNCTSNLSQNFRNHNSKSFNESNIPKPFKYSASDSQNFYNSGRSFNENRNVSKESMEQPDITSTEEKTFELPTFSSNDIQEIDALTNTKSFGFCQWCNFGKKHKNKTWYDIANEDDFKYLEWLLNVEANGSKFEFRINPNCIVHIMTALLRKIDTSVTWRKELSKVDEFGEYKIRYLLRYSTDRVTYSPEITMRVCSKCTRPKNVLNFGKGYICSMCTKIFQ